jgi:hypothetical protein
MLVRLADVGRGRQVSLQLEPQWTIPWVDLEEVIVFMFPIGSSQTVFVPVYVPLWCVE